jgi:hypothetical protein
VISTNRCERNHGYLKSRLGAMPGLKSLASAKRLLPALDTLQLIERDFVRVPPVGAPAKRRSTPVLTHHAPLNHVLRTG